MNGDATHKLASRKIAIIGEYDDIDLTRLATCLRKESVEVFQFELGYLAEDYSVEWFVGEPPVLRHQDQFLDIETLTKCDAVLFKLACMDERPVVDVRMEPKPDMLFATREWNTTVMTALQVLLDSTPGIACGSPLQTLWHDWKPLMLSRALAADVLVPPSLVTTQLPSSFTKRRLVAKAINAEPLIDNGQYYPTTLLDSRLIETLIGSHTLVPSFFQECIDRSVELRTMVIGKRLITARLRSDSDSIDIRYASDLAIEDIQIEDVGDTALGRFAQGCGFTYCCFDSIVDNRGDTWLTDVTPRGSWFWLETEDEPIITRIVATVLGMEGNTA